MFRHTFTPQPRNHQLDHFSSQYKMSNNDDNPRRHHERPEDNPFIAFRRFADSQVSSLLNTVFTLPATIANYNNVHQAREACLFKKADKAQCEKLRELEDDIAELRHEGRELYRVGDLQEVLKKSEELMRLDRHADDLRRNIVDQSGHGASNDDDKEMVHRFANRKGQEWGWDWSWGFPKPFDDDHNSARANADGMRESPSSQSFSEQQRALYEQMMTDARSIFGEEAWDEAMDTVMRTIGEFPSLRSAMEQMTTREFHETSERGNDPTVCCSNRYSPHALERDQEMKKIGVNWRAAYEDLVRAEKQDNEGMGCPVRSRGMYPKRIPWADEDTSDEPSYEYSHDHEDQHDDPPTPKVRQGGFETRSDTRRPAACNAAWEDADINKFLREQEQPEGRQLVLRGLTEACKVASEDDAIKKYLQEQQEQNGLYLGLRESAQSSEEEDTAAETELDAYEQLFAKSKAAQSTPSATPSPSSGLQPSILSTLTTTERTVALDGSVTTKVVLKKRFADGREESSETVHTQRSQESTQVRDPWAAVQKSFAPRDNEKKKDEPEPEKKQGGWFWSS